MTNGIDAIQRNALRVAALMYLLILIPAPFSLVYVPSKLIVPENATATADNIRASETLLRVGIGSELFHQIIVIFLTLALYRLFRQVNKGHARLLVVLGALVEVPVMFLNVLNEIAALILVSGADFLSGFEKSQLDALAFLFLRLHDQGIIIAAIFWGLWLFPFGILIIRSGFIPRFLGFLLFIAGSAHVFSSFTSLLLPLYEHVIDQFATVLKMAEMPTVFWFIIRGFRQSGIAEQAK